MVPRLSEKYKNEIISKMMDKFGYKNRLEVPALKKIVVNMGVGEGAHDIKVLEASCSELARITGQKPIITRAKKAIANFKIKKGAPIGCKVTLRSKRMYEFFDRLVNIALPRIRDFRGVSPNSFDRQGNFTFGLTEQTVFPEVDYDEIKKTQGMDIVIVNTASSRDEAHELLRLFGMPFREHRT